MKWILGLVLALSAPRGIGAATANHDELYKELRPLMESIAILQSSYVDEDKTKSKALIEGAIKGMVSTLDPFSQYMNLQDSNDMRQETVGSFGGLGIEISLKNRQLMVISPIEDTPADKAGIKSGDAIVKINNEPTDGIQLMDAVHKMRGEPGTKVTLSIFREGFSSTKDFTLTRAIIKIQSVKSSLLDPATGYIRLSSFMGKSAEDFSKALDTLKAKGIKDLVVDVRNNPGGLLDAAARIAGNFVPKGKLIVSTDGRNKNKNIRFESEGGAEWKGGLAILINGGSASASEILAGAIQDHGLGVIVGNKSFGKGSVQTILQLSDGSGLRLTTARYLTPKGRSIHGQGISPDVVADEELLGKAYLELADLSVFEAFAKEYLVQHPGFSLDEDEESKKAVKVSESSWEHLKPETRETKLLKDFLDYARAKTKQPLEEEMARDRPRFTAKLKEELVRRQKGEEDARRVLLLSDTQIRRAMDSLKVGALVRDQARNARGK
ncbi:MAG: S41 family peptidase [candidate division FCPU426 bacterium]